MSVLVWLINNTDYTNNNSVDIIRGYFAINVILFVIVCIAYFFQPVDVVTTGISSFTGEGFYYTIFFLPTLLVCFLGLNSLHSTTKPKATSNQKLLSPSDSPKIEVDS